MKPVTMDEYIAASTEAVRPRLQEIREVISASLSGTSEAIKWGNPAFVDADGMILVVFAGYAKHSSVVVTPSALEANTEALKGYTLGKGSMQIPHDQPVPSSLIRQLVEYRLAEYREHGVKWM